MPPVDPRAHSIDFADGNLVVGLEDGREIRVPLEWFPRLRDASLKQLRQCEIAGGGIAVHWPTLDEDILIKRLLGRDCVSCAWRAAGTDTPPRRARRRA